MVTVLTRTIGPSGRDYASFTLAEADVTNIGTSADLVANDEAIVFEADAGTYNESVTFSSTLTTDATRQVTYRPASGAGHDGVFESGVDLTGMIQGSDDHTAFEDIQFSTTATTVNFIEGKAVFFRRCLALINSGHYSLCFVRNATQTEPVSFIDCVFKFVSGTSGVAPTTANASLDAATRFINCTVIGTQDPASTGAFRQIYSSGSTAVTEIINCIVLTGGPAYSETPGGTLVVNGSNNFGGSTSPFPAALQGSPYPITASTAYDPGAGDFALYVGKNGALLDSPNNDVVGQGVGPSANSDVPTTDILGNARSGATANPGAFEQPQATATITKTIGPSGRDYTTFTLAEADVTNIGGSADLVNENERIVFEADAGTYDSGVFEVRFQSTLVTDPTRNVTYRQASGAEHAGQLDQGVRIQCQVALDDDHTSLSGLVLYDPSGAIIVVGSASEGVILDSCVISNPTGNTVVNLDGSGSATYRSSVRNCLVYGNGNSSSRVFAIATYSGDCYAEITHCTIIDEGSWAFFLLGPTTSDKNAVLTNNLVIGSSADLVGYSVDPAIIITGSNNFGPGSGFSSASIAGSPYPITATTDAEGTPASGDFAIHDSNGRLYNITTNDVWQAGIGPASDSDVPTTDILGATRSGTTANPGAFELGVGESNAPPALPGLTNATPDFRVHLDRRVTDATNGVSSTYDASANTTTFTLPYKLNTAATMQVVTRKTSSANAGQSLTVVSTDATNRRVVVSGNHTGTAVFIGEKYTMKYEFSELHLQRNKNTYAAEPITAASHRVRYGRVNYGQTSFFKVTVTPKGGTSSTYVFNGNLLNEPETQLGSVALYDGHFQFPVLADHDRVTIELENDSPLPSRFLSCEWESFYHSRIGSRSRY